MIAHSTQLHPLSLEARLTAGLLNLIQRVAASHELGSAAHVDGSRGAYKEATSEKPTCQDEGAPGGRHGTERLLGGAGGSLDIMSRRKDRGKVGQTSAGDLRALSQKAWLGICRPS